MKCSFMIAKIMGIPFSNNWNLLKRHKLIYKEKVKKIRSIYQAKLMQ